MSEIRDNSNEFNQLESKTRDMLSRLGGMGEVEPSAYLKTRVMARIEERARVRTGFLFWKRVGVGFAGLSLVLGLSLYWALSGGVSYDGLVNRAMLVKLEVTDLALEDVAYAEVILPRDVEFYSKRFPNLALQRTLRVQWQTASSEVPFVIRGLSVGKRKVTVKFYNQQGREVAKKIIAIQFATKNDKTT